MTGELPSNDAAGGSDEDSSLPVTPVAPGYHQARDGLLTRIPVPGGLLSSAQARVVAEVVDECSDGTLTITSRANFQLRRLIQPFAVEVLERLQSAGLVSAQAATNHLRNFMASPTAGLEPDAIVDTRPFVRALDAYVQAHPELGVLPMKFSIGIDGGERASIAEQPNDVMFRAYRERGDARFRVWLRVGANDTQVDLGVTLRPDQVVPFAAAIAGAYREAMPGDGSRPHLHQLLLTDADVDAFRDGLVRRVPAVIEAKGTLLDARVARPPVGVHAQAAEAGEDGIVYVGLVPLLGALTSPQLRGIADLADRYGSSALRLSPWRNVIVPDIRVGDVEPLQAALDVLGLPSRAEAVVVGLVACAGITGCTAGLADTVRDAQALSVRLLATPGLNLVDLDVHFAGCAKGCAHRRPAAITAVGRAGDVEAYDVFVAGDGDPRLGRRIFENVSATAIVDEVERLLRR